MKVAVFDLGSNTTKLLVSDVDGSSVRRVLAEESRACRLTAGGGEKIRFTEKSIERTLGVLGELMEIAKVHNVQRTKAVATEAFRRSDNSHELISLAKESLDLSISILSGSEEAGAIAAGLLSDPSISGIDDFHAIDLGGGSMEVIAVKERLVTSLESLPLGAAVISNLFCPAPGSPWTEEACAEAQNHVRSFLIASDASALLNSCSTLVGAGGTLVFLRKILENESGFERKENGVLELSDSIALFERISRMTLQQRAENFPGLPPSRSDIFPGGLLVLNEVMNYFSRPEIIHSYHNLRHGIAMELAKED
jgi:exopolyphosphatase / guanosine-5'-triphosphate,3'-diphosphate pyrophosphatase